MRKYNVEAITNGAVIQTERGVLDYGSAAILAEIIWPRDGVTTIHGCVKPEIIRIYEYTKKSKPEMIREYAIK